MKRFLLPILPVAALLAANGQQARQANPSAQPRFTITDLGTLGGTTTKGYGI